MAGQSLYALIAGVGPGTGRAIALRFAKAYPVVLLARNAESYQSTVEDVTKAGGRAIGIEVDVGDASSIGNAFNGIEKALPGSQLAAAVYNLNSGFLVKPFLDMKPEEFRSRVGGVAFALRAVSQSLAREFGPQGVHVAHAMIDGLIDTPVTRAWGNSSEPDSMIQPDAVAETYWHLHTQPRSAFTHEIDIRPFSKKF
ncbi:putative short chain dehydrogenase protein [Eutypa lata UCREL1]|uniref:Putative short chain dehydrogenase protein n=1 Tax=Eutypa lata (strain UCR-EL1) TaxID=1287681 RepID=M7TPJ2_EUTLA|nr:putative short chain dehydrogenase protein [Eutypa lata UCREL1]